MLKFSLYRSMNHREEAPMARKKSLLERVGEALDGDDEKQAARKAPSKAAPASSSRRKRFGSQDKVQGGGSIGAHASEGDDEVATATQPQAAPPRTHTVVAGDTLGHIAQRYYGDANQWQRIVAANREKISNPDLIHPGQTFIIPE